MTRNDAYCVWKAIERHLPHIAERVVAQAEEHRAKRDFADDLRKMAEAEDRKRQDLFADALFDEIKKAKKKP